MIDLIFLTVCVRVCYIAVTRGIFNELFKIGSVLLGSFLAFHYYPYLAEKIASKVEFFKEEAFYLIIFLAIFLSSSLIFSALRRITLSFFKREKISRWERIVSLMLGGLRFVFLSSIFIFIFYLSPANINYISRSFSYRAFKNIAPQVYLISIKWYNKINTHINVNEEVERYNEIKKILSRGSKERH